MSSKIKLILIGLIWAITAYDIYCCGVLRPEDELNPLARWVLIHYGVWALCGSKVFGTYLATEWLRHLPLMYTVIVSIGMVCLFLFLLT